ncbi:MAG TPA: hypothetical protein DCL95_10485, partial [Rhodospirillaceae bacterium]|nr:hypothetical protein [Rhodospirillaceae bacterium]
RKVPLADRLVTVIAPGADLPPEHPASGKGLVDGRPAAYICVGPVCSLPLVTPDAITEHLRGLVA